MVLSASRLTQTIDAAPAAVTVIDQRTIKASGARDLASLFRLVPGMTVGLYNGRKATLGFHDFSDPYFRQFQVLIDGVSIYSPMWGGGEWGELPVAIEDIERLEVVRGPNAAAFGANAFLGVVNIITRDPATESRFAAATNIGESGIRDVLVRMAVHEGDLRYRLTAGQRGLATRIAPQALVHRFFVGISIAVRGSTDWWNIRIDALTGEFLNKNNWTQSCDFGHGIPATDSKVLHSQIACQEDHGSVNQAGSYNVLPVAIRSAFIWSESDFDGSKLSGSFSVWLARYRWRGWC